MEISLARLGRSLRVTFDDLSIAERHFRGSRFVRRYRCSRGITFTLEKCGRYSYLFVGFDGTQDLGVLYQILNRECVEELRLLWELAHMPGSRIYETRVKMLDGIEARLIDSVAFVVQKVAPCVWESNGNVPEAARFYHQVRLAGLQNGVPGTYEKIDLDSFEKQLACTVGEEILFVDEVMEGTRPDAAKPALPEEGHPDEIGDCVGCEGLFHKGELLEARPGLWLCQFCRIDHGVAQAFGLKPGEIPGLCADACDECGCFMAKDELTEVSPGRWLCFDCILAEYYGCF